MAEKRDYYDVLGVARGASEDVVKKGYRQMAKQYHPDLNPGNAAAEEKMKEVNEAYGILSDPEKKTRYDQFGHAGVDPNSAAGGGFGGGFGGGVDVDLSDLFGGIFGGFGGGARSNPNAPRQGSDLEERLTISFVEAAKGCKRTLDLNRVESCDECNGSGAAKGTTQKKCSDCGGTGQKTVQQRTPLGVMSTSRPCQKCNGRGRWNETPCPKCRGGGRVRKRSPLEVAIPAGIDHGQVLRVPGEGNRGTNGGPPGDLLIGVAVRPHELFHREGYDLHCEVTVQFWQAALGDTLSVPTLEGTVDHKLPAGTQPGTVTTLRGQGIPMLQSARKGDLHVRVQVAVPQSMSAQERSLVEQMKASFPANPAPVTPKQPPHEDRSGFFKKNKK